MNFDPEIIQAPRAVARLAIDGYVQYALLGKGPPVGPPCRFSKIVAVELNYKAHAAEMKKALPPSPCCS